VRVARRRLVKLFKKPKSKFYWYDFTVRGRRYRGSTQETKSVRALQVASLKLASSMENTDPLPTKPTALRAFADRFLTWVDSGRLEDKTRKSYRNGWRLLKATAVAEMRVDQITGDCAEQLKFPWPTVIERSAYDFQFRVLIAHRGLYVAVAPGSHHGRSIARSHQNSRTVVMSRTVKNQLFRKGRFFARFSKEIAN
jgi:hypothetical protein